VVSPLAAKRRSAGYTQESLAARLGHDRTTIGRWERGENEPEPWNRSALAEALSITLDELAHLLPAVAIEDEAPAHRSTNDNGPLDCSPSLPDTVATIAALGRYDMNRRTFIRSTVFSAAAAVAPSRDWLIATLDQAMSARGRVSTAEVDAIRHTFDTWNEIDVIKGGGRARAELSTYVTGHVLPLLETNSSDAPQGRALFEAAGEQLYILSRMAYDDGQAGLAEAYLLQALRLAQEARAPDLGAHILAGLSDQASFAGAPTEAIQVAKAGRHGLSRRPSPACEARLLALQAKAEGMCGDHRAAAVSVAASEAAFDRVAPGDEPSWARYIDVAYLTGEYANAFKELDRPDETERFARASIADSERQGRARRGSFAQTALARAALARHEPDRAGIAAKEAVRLAISVDSSRSRSGIRDLQLLLRPHITVPSVAEFFENSQVLLAG
jgi:transcriptional regulator with XRE-family HTH domain